jgi:hypothetical protein
MSRESNIDFLSIIHEVFDPVLQKFGFEINNGLDWSGAGEYSTIASKDGITLHFYVGLSPLFYYCSVSISLSGEIAEKATARSKYRNLGVTAIAKALDSNHKQRRKAAQTKEEVIAMFEAEKQDLLKYCSDILSEDVSTWSKVANSLAEELKKSKGKR